MNTSTRRTHVQPAVTTRFRSVAISDTVRTRQVTPHTGREEASYPVGIAGFLVAGTRNCLYLLLIAIDLPLASEGRGRYGRESITN